MGVGVRVRVRFSVRVRVRLEVRVREEASATLEYVGVRGQHVVLLLPVLVVQGELQAVRVRVGLGFG